MSFAGPIFAAFAQPTAVTIELDVAEVVFRIRLLAVGHARLCQLLLTSKPVVRVSEDLHCMFVLSPLAHMARRLHAQNRAVSR